MENSKLTIDNLFGQYLELIEKNRIKEKLNTNNKENLKIGPHINFGHYIKQLEVKDLIDNKEDKVKNVLKLFNSGQDEKGISELNKKIAENEQYKYIHSISNKNRLSVFLGLSKDNKENENKLNEFFDKISEQIKKLAKEINENNNSNSVSYFIENIYGTDKTLLGSSYKNQIPRAIYEILYCYLLHEVENKQIPLINGCALDVMRWIWANEEKLDEKIANAKGNQKIIETISYFINKITIEIKINDSKKISKYYILDQFFNAIHKITGIELNNIEKAIEPFYKEIYQYQETYLNGNYYTSLLNDFKENLQNHKNIIYYGAPGTGKTYIAELCSKMITEEKDKIKDANAIKALLNKNNEKVKIVQFHPSYSYEDFIEGIRPTIDKDLKQMGFEYKSGHFKSFVDNIKSPGKVNDNFDNAYFFIIDEINRANLSTVFGEILYCLEKRGHKITTQYSHLNIDEKTKEFSIPENVYVIGTMNDIDRSIDAFDLALRRRFMWIRLDFEKVPLINHLMARGLNYTIIENYVEDCVNLNKFLSEVKNNGSGLGLGKSYELGHAYYMRIVDFFKEKDKINDTNFDIIPAKKKLFENHLMPLLKEYLRTKYSEIVIEEKLEAMKKQFIDND